ncbi:HK97 family phage prohead protease [Tranquillimonas alkanivorans]|uniref:Prohead serine protease domain-containing protein n=1 Tax=Tranquillimonas alkanivorans TaxID=441119 RepID=A0A1I5RWB3_9RHOB|nr:HK97 family phage prohead protease [Tranquillimonas alkanivorans]SFP62869.1 prohead peptidase. Unknown type peptidase. MEROPS family U35 [Tranquillimonas alkanivorans]
MDRLFLETKIMAEDDGAVSGIAWKFGSGDRIGDWIEPGAFKAAQVPLPMLFGHDQNDPIGTWDTAEEKADGLHLTGKLLTEEVARAREVRALVRSGAVRGISIGFITRKAAARPGGGRTIKSLELLEASLVTLPMHPGARVTSAKSAVRALSLAASLQRATAQLAKR